MLASGIRPRIGSVLGLASARDDDRSRMLNSVTGRLRRACCSASPSGDIIDAVENPRPGCEGLKTLYFEVTRPESGQEDIPFFPRFREMSG